MFDLLKSAFFSSLLVTSLASITEVIEWDGTTVPDEIHIIPGDTVFWKGSFSGAFGFALGETPFELSSNYTFTFDEPGSFPYGLATVENSLSGLVVVSPAQIFDNMILEYHLQINDVVRWQWEGDEPGLPSFFYGFCSHPGYSQMREGAFDFAFLIPGQYGWFHNSQVYKFEVQDLDPSPHLNVAWGPNGNQYVQTVEAGSVIRFYATEDRRTNVHVYQQTEMGEQSVWVSADLESIGDSAPYGFAPGMYIARSDYDMNYTFAFNAVSNQHHSGSGSQVMVPKTLVYAAELSLFMIGLLGLGHFLIDHIGPNENQKDRKDPTPPGGEGGGDITSYALARAQERVSKVNA
jgi:plastocyanin